MIHSRKLVVFAVTTASMTALVVHAQSAGAIEGRVTNSVTGEGVSGVKVRFLDPKRHAYDTLTDAAGSYHLAGLSEGDYRGEFTKDGFVDDSRNLSNPSFHVSGDTPVRADTQL